MSCYEEILVLLMDLDLVELEVAVIEFSSLMCQHYDKEDERREKVLEALNNIFECCLTPRLTPITSSLVSDDRHSDGHIDGPAGVLKTIVKIKNELGTGETDPEIQLMAYYVQSITEGLSGRHRGLFNRFLFPALGISLMGKGHKSDFFETLVVITHILLSFFRFVYWIQRSCTSRQA